MNEIENIKFIILAFLSLAGERGMMESCLLSLVSYCMLDQLFIIGFYLQIFNFSIFDTFFLYVQMLLPLSFLLFIELSIAQLIYIQNLISKFLFIGFQDLIKKATKIYSLFVFLNEYLGQIFMHKYMVIDWNDYYLINHHNDAFWKEMK